jgi:hypothetical protein
MSDEDLVWAHMSQEALARLVQRVVGTVGSLRYLQHGSLTSCDSSWPNRRTQLSYLSDSDMTRCQIYDEKGRTKLSFYETPTVQTLDLY